MFKLCKWTFCRWRFIFVYFYYHSHYVTVIFPKVNKVSTKVDGQVIFLCTKCYFDILSSVKITKLHLLHFINLSPYHITTEHHALHQLISDIQTYRGFYHHFVDILLRLRLLWMPVLMKMCCDEFVRTSKRLPSKESV